MMKSIFGTIKIALILVFLLATMALMYLVYSANDSKADANRLCQETYPNSTEVVGIVGLDIGTVCFDESGANVKFLGMLEE